MRICPGCRSVYPALARTCSKDGLDLIDYSITFPHGAAERDSLIDVAPLGLSDETTIQPGMIVGDYRVERIIAHGGMGVIYAAVHPLISKRVAIKVLNRRFAQDAEQIARFVMEARAVNQVGHHNIVDIFAIGELNDGRKYLVMELLDGLELNRILANVGRFEPGEIRPIYEQLCDGLAAAHAKGFVHRDLKPENVTVLRRHPYPFIKILDFGIAKLRGSEQTAVGTVLGTPEYMAPEQCRAGPIDARVDIYSLGVMLYELVTGQKPFSNPDPLRLLAMQTKEAPKPPSKIAPIDAELERVILKAMAKHPAQRHQTVGELIAELRQAIPQTLPWTASLDPPAEAPADRTLTLPPITASTSADDPADTDKTRVPDSSLRGATRPFPGEGHFELPPADRTAQVAVPGAVTSLSFTTGSLVEGAQSAQGTWKTDVDSGISPSKPLGFSQKPGRESSTELVEATLLVPLRAHASGTSEGRETLPGLNIPLAVGPTALREAPIARETRPTPTSIDFNPPVPATGARNSRSSMVVGTIQEEPSRQSSRAAGNGRRLSQDTSTSHTQLEPHDTPTQATPALVAHATKTSPSAPPPMDLARTSPLPKPGDTDQMPQLDFGLRDSSEDQDTTLLPRLEDSSLENEKTTLVDSARFRRPAAHHAENAAAAQLPLYRQEETTYHIPRASRQVMSNLTAGLLAFVIVLGTALVVGALLLLTYGP